MALPRLTSLVNLQRAGMVSFLRAPTEKFSHCLFENARAQAAEMTIENGGSENGPNNARKSADQCLFFIDGVASRLSRGKRRALKRDVLLLIEKGGKHEIRNTGPALLRTLFFYTPPAYTHRGTRLARVDLKAIEVTTPGSAVAGS